MSCSEWKEYSLSELIEIIGGGTPKTTVEEYWNGEINWISIKDFNGDSKYILDTEKKITELGLKKSSTKLLKEKDIIISARGTVGALGVIKSPMAFNQSCYGLRANDKVNPDFLYYLLKNSINILKNNTHGSVFNTITKDTFNHINVNIPNLKEQEKIANVLSSLDNKIELNNEMNKTLEEMAQSIFKRWFIDFEFPNEEGNPYKSSGGEMVESELGMIPKGWEVKELGSICEVKGGKRLPKGMSLLDNKTSYPYLRVTDVTNGYVNMNSIKYIDEQTREKISRYIIEYNDLYISIAGTIGLVGGINKKLDKASLTENMARIICNNINKNYVRLYLNSEEIQNMIKLRAVGSTQPKLPLYVIKDISLLIPEKTLIEKFSSIVDFIYLKLEENLLNNDGLNEIRDSLLGEIMSGVLEL